MEDTVFFQKIYFIVLSSKVASCLHLICNFFVVVYLISLVIDRYKINDKASVVKR